MNLAVYLAERNLTIRAFSAQCDVHPQYMSCIKTGTKKPGKKLSKRIEKETGGLVVISHKKGNTQNEGQKNESNEPSEA